MENTQSPTPKKGIGCLHVLLVLIVILLAAILASMWWLKQNMYAKDFTPVELEQEELAVLDEKLNTVDPSTRAFGSGSYRGQPGEYAEDDTQRKIIFTQEELNAVLAKDPEFARRVKFHLSDDMISLQFLAPMDKEIPVLAGKTFRFNMGLTVAYSNGSPVVAVRGISIGGIPVPGAWWGDVKGINLVEEFGSDGGFWQLFSRGVDYVKVADGSFILYLKE